MSQLLYLVCFFRDYLMPEGKLAVLDTEKSVLVCKLSSRVIYIPNFRGLFSGMAIITRGSNYALILEFFIQHLSSVIFLDSSATSLFPNFKRRI